MSGDDSNMGDGGISFEELREFSIAEYDKEFGTTDPEESDGWPDPEEEDVAETKKQPKSKEVEEEPEEEVDGAEDDTEEESEEDEETEAEGEEDEDEDEDEDDKHISAKAKNGKAVKVPKDALIEVKIDGKVESLTVQEVINKASGAVALDRKHTELGRERAVLKREKEEFERKAEVTKDNLQMLQTIAESGSPEDFAQYYGLLVGKDPSNVLETIVTNALNYAKTLSQMTERELMMYNENRKFKFQNNLSDIQRRREEQKQTYSQERAQVDEFLKTQGLTVDDFLAAAEEVKQGIASGERTGRYSAMDIAQEALKRQHHSKVQQAISFVDKSLLSDEKFYGKVSKAIAGTEQATGEKFSVNEAKTLVKRLIEKDKKGISESLSRKVERAKKSGKTNSKFANSRNQKNISDEAITLQEHWDRLYGGN